MSKEKNKLSLIQKAQKKFKKFKEMDLNYRTILSEALTLIYKIHQSVSDDELENECKKVNLAYNPERKLSLILELCIPKPEKTAAQERYKARLRMYARGLDVFIKVNTDGNVVQKKLKVYGIEFFANPREKDDEYIQKIIHKNDDENDSESTKKVSSEKRHKPLSERTINFFTKNKVDLNSAVIFMIDSDVYCSHDTTLINQLKDYRENSTYEFSSIDSFSNH